MTISVTPYELLILRHGVIALADRHYFCAIQGYRAGQLVDLEARLHGAINNCVHATVTDILANPNAGIVGTASAMNLSETETTITKP